MYKEEIKQKEGRFFSNYTLVGKVEKKDAVFKIVNNLEKRIIDEKNLDKYLIRELNIHYTRENQTVSVEIDYYKFNPEELKAKPVEEQIHTVLIQMGYSESSIGRIEYRWPASMFAPRVWVAEVHDERYSEALRNSEYYLTEEISKSLMKIAEKVLDFQVYFEFY